MSTLVLDILRQIYYMISPVPLHTQERSMKYAGPEPDFLEAISPGGCIDYSEWIPLKYSVFTDDLLNFRRLRSLFIYPALLELDDFPDNPRIIAKQLCN
jgi:hypothetical protein